MITMPFFISVEEISLRSAKSSGQLSATLLNWCKKITLKENWIWFGKKGK